MMLKAFILFYLRLFRESVCPPRKRRVEPDPAHFHRRRFTRKYIRKRGIVKNLWISAGILMLSFPLLPFIAGLSLFMTFVSFLILDETS